MLRVLCLFKKIFQNGFKLRLTGQRGPKSSFQTLMVATVNTSLPAIFLPYYSISHLNVTVKPNHVASLNPTGSEPASQHIAASNFRVNISCEICVGTLELSWCPHTHTHTSPCVCALLTLSCTPIDADTNTRRGPCLFKHVHPPSLLPPFSHTQTHAHTFLSHPSSTSPLPLLLLFSPSLRRRVLKRGGPCFRYI